MYPFGYGPGGYVKRNFDHMVDFDEIVEWGSDF
jgi:hypothetical protein